MNTKLLMMLCAIILGAGGVLLSFMPDLVLSFLKINVNYISLLVMQTVGALYFAFGMLSWMTKSGLIGGIYSRPIAVANFTHFLIVAIAFLKALISNPDVALVIWILGAIYLVFALSFTLILFRHPLKEKKPV